MRILAISFKNLNSLTGEWHINLEDPGFLAEGIFLITGPTGAGKTTLLDAICLALYGCTPRTEDGSATEIMSRHTGACYAEVKFETASGRYTAHWSQQRARGRANGNLQKVEWHLADESGKIIESAIRKTKKKIEELAGLDYSQFTRAILLAQGKFAAFLLADRKEKSEILENLADISIYSELSRLAHIKAGEESAKVNALKQELSRMPVLDAEAEKNREEALAACLEKLRQLDELQETSQKKLAWLQNLAVLEQDSRQLTSEWDILLAEKAQFEPVAKVLAEARMAAPAVEFYNHARDSRGKLDECAAKLRQCESKLAQCRQAWEQSGICLTEARKFHDDTQKEFTDSQELFAQVRTLDAALRDREGGRKEAASKEKQLAGRLQKIALEQQNNQARLQKNSLELDKLRAWMHAHARYEWLVENLAGLKEKLHNLQSLKKRQADAEKLMDSSATQLRQIDLEIKNLTAKLDKDAEQKTLRGQQLEKQKKALEQLLDGSSRENLLALFGDLTKKRGNAELAAKLEDLRDGLRPGEPCPLCGALDHPFAQAGLPPMDDLQNALENLENKLNMLAELEREINQANLDLAGMESANVALNERLRGILKNRRLLSDQYGENQRQKEGLESEYAIFSGQVSGILQEMEVDFSDNVTEMLTRLAEKCDAWRKTHKKLQDLQSVQTDLAAAMTGADREKEHIASALLEQRQALGKLEEEIALLTGQRQKIFGDKDVDHANDRLKENMDKARKKLETVSAREKELAGQVKTVEGERMSLQRQQSALLTESQTATVKFANMLASLQLDEDKFMRMRRDPEEMASMESQEKALATRETILNARRGEIDRKLRQYREQPLTDATEEKVALEMKSLKEEQQKQHEERARLKQELEQTYANRLQRRELEKELAAQERENKKWAALDALIGSFDGKKFRLVAQNVTMDRLLRYANAQLEKITDRYQLIRSSMESLDLDVIDHYQADERRSIKTLSGGETFIASLALALGMSVMAGKRDVMGSLFLDEGFGTLDTDTLDIALGALSGLRQEGKLIGIISHVDILKQRIAAHIEIHPKEMGKSEIAGTGVRRLG